MRENGVDISWYKNDYMREKQMGCMDESVGHGGSVMTVKGDLIAIERRDFGCDLPLGPDIVFSMNPALRPQNANAAREAKSIASEFGPGAKVTVSERMGKDRRRRETAQVVVRFPTVKASGPRPRAHEYFVRAEKADGTLLKEGRVYSPGINLPETKDAPETICVFAKRDVEGAARFVVRPANCWGVKGTALVG